MRRSAWIFLAAILLPSLVLAWLAVRSARDQQVILEHQQAIICQDITDALAKKVQDEVDSSRSTFVQTTDQLLRSTPSPQALAASFNQRLHATWNLAEVGFAVDLSGTIYSPRPQEGLVARIFRNENDRFLSNREDVEVFAQKAAPSKLGFIFPQSAAADTNQRPAPVQQGSQGAKQSQSEQDAAQRNRAPDQNAAARVNQPGNQTRSPQGQAVGLPDLPNRNQSVTNPEASPSDNRARRGQQSNAQQENARANQSAANNSTQAQSPNQMTQQVASQDDSGHDQDRALLPVKKNNKAAPVQRQVEPQSNFAQNAVSNTVPEESDFRRVIASETSGAVARFLEDKLRLMVWYRPKGGSLVFGAQIMQQGLVENLQPLLQSPDFQKTANPSRSADYSLVILDDRGKPVVASRPAFAADWKHPLAATEIGEALPHWEAALYLLDPKQINRSASTLQLALGLIVVVLVAAILLGGWLMAADVRRQMRLAQQKTDFVSNVSHELKTPLTSIRMFADMLVEGRVSERDRQTNFLRIISAESARLTRLINNVLDFARMERGAPACERRQCDLVEVVREVVNTCRPHLESVGVALSEEIQADQLSLIGDRDELAQIILNLLSNAEKYGGNEILVRVRREKTSAGEAGCVDVLDRGPGIPEKKRETIFQPFQRLNDSLASGVSGSGLGLTLARRMARAHGGDVSCSPRKGGGSCFTVTLPLRTIEAQNKVSRAQEFGNES
jgi:signal transduction histidine kinase